VKTLGDRLDRDRIELGRGTRVMVKGGRFDAEYQSTVPESAERPTKSVARA